MDIIQNSKDLLYVAISFGVILLSVFTAWLIFYFVMITKQFYEVVKDMRERIKKVDAAIHSFKEKIDNSASYLLLIGEGVKKLVDLAREFTGAKKEKAKSKSTKK